LGKSGLGKALQEWHIRRYSEERVFLAEGCAETFNSLQRNGKYSSEQWGFLLLLEG